MDSIFHNFSSSILREDPYPHFVINPALPEPLYSQLYESYPADPNFYSDLYGQDEVDSNRRYQISAARVYQEPTILPKIWKDFVFYHTSADFFKVAMLHLAPIIRKTHPQIEERLGSSLEEVEVGVRGVDDTPILLDCQPGINSPVVNSSRVRGPHLDNPLELYASLLYMRTEEDDSTGGDLTICRTKRKGTGSRGAEFYDGDIEVTNKVPYGKNTLAFFVNSRDSIHGVTPRGITSHCRRLVNIIGELNPKLEGLFSYPDRSSTLLGRLRAKVHWYRTGEK